MADDLPAIADIAIAAYSGYGAAMGREPAPMRAGNICCFRRQIKPVSLPRYRCLQCRKCLSCLVMLMELRCDGYSIDHHV